MSASPSSPLSGRLWLAAMGLFLALAGALFTWGLFQAYQKAEETRRWTPTPCVIISSKLRSERPTIHSNIEHWAEVRYVYTFGGKEQTGTRVKRVEGGTVHEESARKKLEQFPVGLETTCYVNPAQPDLAVLVHDTRAALYSIWFPMLFVAGGLGMAWNALRGPRQKAALVKE